MLAELKLKTFKELVENSSRDELIWMNGFLSGIVIPESKTIFESEVKSTSFTKKITISYATETGNSKKLAVKLAGIAKQKGITVKLTAIDQFKPEDIVKEEYFFLIISTQGEGEPPEQALKFFNYIHNEELNLEKLNFGVLALGDSSYPLFCQAGEDVDRRLTQLGAKPSVSLKKCDVDYAEDANNWFESVLNSLTESPSTQKEVKTLPIKSNVRKSYSGKVITSINLNDTGSSKETYHIEISTEETVDYLPGDAIGIFPKNEQSLVTNILQTVGIDSSTEIIYKEKNWNINDLLVNHLNVLNLPIRITKEYAKIVNQHIPEIRIDLFDLLRIYPVTKPALFLEIVQVLEPIQPRLYSISSAPSANEGEIHITVARSATEVEDQLKFGFCSNFLALFEVGKAIEFYVHKNESFKLPEDDKHIILIGPGTGIAPFRSFLAERDATGATGHNWLFFGEQHFETDFLYQTEIQNWAMTDLLQNVNLAFSRDQEEKIYVQDRLKEQGAQVWYWINNGAYLYVCGTKDPMSKDVEKALLDIFISNGNKSEEEAKALLEHLADEGRYLKDVY